MTVLATPQQIIEAFHRHNVKGDGLIAREDLAWVIGRLEPTCWSKARLDRLFAAAGMNSEENIEYATFISWLVAGELGAEDLLLIQFRSLSRTFQDKALQWIKKLCSAEEAHVLYTTTLSEADRENMRILMKSFSNSMDQDITSVNLAEFRNLHNAVDQVLRVSDVVIASAEECFDHFDLQHNGKLHSSEIALWFQTICQQSLCGISSCGELLERVTLRARAITAVETYARTVEVQRNLGQYGEQWRKLKQDSNFKPVESRLPPIEKPMFQPVVAGSTTATLDDILAQGKQIVRKVEVFGKEMSLALKAPFWSMGPLKERKRSEQKVQADYKGNARKLVDVVRLSMVCDDMDMVHAAIKYCDEHKDVEVVRVKSLFSLDKDNSVLSGGYRDVKLNVKHKSNNHIFEIQLHLFPFYTLKREEGHTHYEWFRRLKVQGITSPRDVLEDFGKALLKEMIDVIKESLPYTIRENGEDSVQVAETRSTLADICSMAYEQETLKEQIVILMKQLETHSIIGASALDLASIYLTCASSGVLSGDVSLDLMYKAKSTMGHIDEMTETEKMFMAKCDALAGSVLWRKGDFPAAASSYRTSVAIFDELVKKDHPALNRMKIALGGVLNQIHELDEALRVLKQVEAHTTHAVLLSRLHMELGKTLEAKHRFDEAAEYYSKTLQNRLADFGDDHPAVANARLAIGRCFISAGRHDEARVNLKLAHDIYSPRLKSADEVCVNGRALIKSHTEVESLLASLPN